MKAESKEDLRFGLTSPSDWLDKARRELVRLQKADGLDKVDHAINIAITISQTADWCFNQALSFELVETKDRSNFLNSSRRASLDTAILTDISNSNKHFKLDRKPVSTALSVSSGEVTIPMEFLFSHFVTPQGEPFKEHLKAMRTIVDDEEIIGFEYIVGEQRVLTEHGYLSFEVTCSEAIRFWEETIASIQNNEKPSWLK